MSEQSPAVIHQRLPSCKEMVEAPSESMASKHMVLIDSIIAWMLANPGEPLTKCALAIQKSPQWVRMVASTDLFKARLAEQRETLLEEVGIMGLKAKIAAAADLAVERLAQKLEFAENVDSIVGAADMLLEKHFALQGVGGGGGKGAMVQVNVQAIMQGREAMLNGTAAQAPIEVQVKEEGK